MMYTFKDAYGDELTVTPTPEGLASVEIYRSIEHNYAVVEVPPSEIPALIEALRQAAGIETVDYTDFEGTPV